MVLSDCKYGKRKVGNSRRRIVTFSRSVKRKYAERKDSCRKRVFLRANVIRSGAKTPNDIAVWETISHFILFSRRSVWYKHITTEQCRDEIVYIHSWKIVRKLTLSVNFWTSLPIPWKSHNIIWYYLIINLSGIQVGYEYFFYCPVVTLATSS